MDFWNLLICLGLFLYSITFFSPTQRVSPPAWVGATKTVRAQADKVSLSIIPPHPLLQYFANGLGSDLSYRAKPVGKYNYCKRLALDQTETCIKTSNQSYASDRCCFWLSQIFFMGQKPKFGSFYYT